MDEKMTDRLWYEINKRDLFHVYLNRYVFHFLRLHINKTNKCSRACSRCGQIDKMAI